MRLTKEAKALAVLEWLEIGPQNMHQIVTMEWSQTACGPPGHRVASGLRPQLHRDLPRRVNDLLQTRRGS